VSVWGWVLAAAQVLAVGYVAWTVWELRVARRKFNGLIRDARRTLGEIKAIQAQFASYREALRQRVIAESKVPPGGKVES
jgi:hypothetical protein